MKQRMLLIFAAALLISGCSAELQSKTDYEGDFAEKGSDTDITRITESYSETDSKKNAEIELLYAAIYSSILSDESKKANRVIGKIEGEPITAKEMELEALRVQLIGSKDVYSDAWNRLEIYVCAKQAATEYGISVDQDAQKQTHQNRKWIEEEKNGSATKYINDLCEAYNMEADEFWDLQLELMKRQLITSRVKRYLKEHNLCELNNTLIQSEITDEEYIEKTKGVRWDSEEKI